MGKKDVFKFFPYRQYKIWCIFFLIGSVIFGIEIISLLQQKEWRVLIFLLLAEICMLGLAWFFDVYTKVIVNISSNGITVMSFHSSVTLTWGNLQAVYSIELNALLFWSMPQRKMVIFASSTISLWKGVLLMLFPLPRFFRKTGCVSIPVRARELELLREYIPPGILLEV